MDAFYYAIAESLYPILLSLVVFIFPYSHIVEGALIFTIVDLIQRSINPIKEISGKIANIQRARTGIDRITNFLLDIKTNENSLNSFINGNNFKNFEVSIPFFEYKLKSIGTSENSIENRDKFFLNDIKFNGAKGDLIGIVGLSGSGKSTLLNILSGTLLAPQSKVNIEFENLTIDILDTHRYLLEVSLVSQDSHIFSETLMFNITMSNERDENFEKRWAYFKQNIPYLEKWGITPNDKIIAAKLSLGQRQLLAGIRALYLNKNIVIFDEISSALDPELELSLRKMVLLIQKNSLTIIVAHRVETILDATKILVMEKGRIIQSGKHDELLKSSMVYQKFIEELSHS
jgi:ATP-binding cassette subfamily B protein